MTLEKVIENLTQIERFSNYPFMPTDKESLRIAIEAVKREKEHRELDIDTHFGLLPGETKD